MGILQWLQNIITLNHNFTWAYVWKYILSAPIIQGVILTIILAVISQFLGTLIGLLLYFMGRSRLGFVRGISAIYVWLFRGTPLLVQVYVFYFLFPYLHLTQPLRRNDLFSAIGFTHGIGPIFMDAFLAGLLAFSLNEGAYMREIVPPLGNEFNNMLKNTSLATAAGLYELLGTANGIGGPLFATLELLVVASVWYLLLTTIWGIIQGYIERRLNVSNIDVGAKRPNWAQRVFGFLPRSTAVNPATFIPPEH
jgi:polar amino acid transport system permease protein